MSLSATVYSFCYIGAALFLVVGLYRVGSGIWAMSAKEICYSFMIGTLAGIAVYYCPHGFRLARRLFLRLRRGNRRKTDIDKTDIENRAARYLLAAVLIFGAYLLVPYPLQWFSVTWSEGLVGFVAGILVWCALFFLAQLRKVRRGLYSYEGLWISWRYVLECCHLVPQSASRQDADSQYKAGTPPRTEAP